mmetsp:Transcript_107950/g.315686  ORF Transcript_107950/g.315686 Transcript_107950/m.315686 type:complete len:272 (-) Transcript_107950:77-892(-)
MMSHLDAVRLQLGRVPHAAEHQELRRAHGPRGEDDLLPGQDPVRGALGVHGLHAHGATALEDEAQDTAVRRHGQPRRGLPVLLRLRPEQGPEVAVRGAGAHAVAAHGHVHLAEALLLEAVHVLGPRIASLNASFNESIVDGLDCFRSAAADAERTTAAPVQRGARLMCLRLLEVGQHLAVAPPLAADLPRPALVVQGVAPDVGHGVEARGAAQDLAARLVEAPAIQVLLRHSVVVPVVLVVGQVERQRRRHVDLPGVQRAAIAPSSLHQQD